ncbi:hypothetical protein CC86DRAFT_295060 [Ophiobolus disseminans]|uniref:Uncharacterized protein n=1 Tax=Ophiobolus disseminans TaxID=1469910 RepID=A0A6A6ZW84_9PLEO|nr:hypothetical protein CC86DRAFT_295060 [Ophiobolus disseminans]
MTERIAKPRGRKKKETMRANVAMRAKDTGDSSSGRGSSISLSGSQPEAAPFHIPVQTPSIATERKDSADLECAITLKRYRQKTPTFYQPSNIKAEALDAAFLAHYVRLNASSRTYSPEIQWINHLPRLFAEATKPAVRLSLRAISMASYARSHHDPSIMVDSWRWYSVSLRAQRISLSKLKGDEIPEEGEVLVPIILTLYELYFGTAASSSMVHIGAAAKIMNMRGPSNCRTGAIWPLFKGIRNAEAHQSVIAGKPSVYSSPDWMTIPFIDMPRDAHQRIADIELMIPVCMEKLQTGGNLRVCFETRIPSGADLEPCRKLTIKLLADLHDWAASYPNLTTISDDPHDTWNVAKRSGLGLDIANEDSSSPPLPDSFISLIASMYLATKLTVNMLMHKMDTEGSTPPSTIPRYFEEACWCAETILRGAAIVEKAQTPGFDLVRSIAPLIIVICVGPKEGQSQAAREMLQRWGAKIGGLSSIMDMHMLSSTSTKRIDQK